MKTTYYKWCRTSIALTFLMISFTANAQFPAFPPSTVTNVQDRDQMMWQLGLNFLTLPPKAQDKNKPPYTWPSSMSGPEDNWTDSAGHTITRGGHGLWNNYDDDNTGFLPGGHNNNILNGPEAWRVGNFPAPNLLKMNNGTVITTPAQWWSMRRPELERDAAESLYGVLPPDSILPKIKYVITVTTGGTGAGAYIQKTITGYIDSSRYPAVRNKPRLTATLRIPANAPGPVPVIIVFSTGTDAAWNITAPQGFGVCSYNYSAIQPDNGVGLTSYIIGLCNKGNWRKPNDWGVLRAWAWGASKIMDTIRYMPEVDSNLIGVEGHSRWGKGTLVTAAFDQRFAFAYPSCAGSLGTAMARHHWGEELEGSSWDQQYHWVAGNFFKWMGPYYNTDSLNAMGITDSLTRQRMLYMPRKVINMPIDAHSIVALVAPRPILINGGNQDSWSDPSGEYQAGAKATPVYNLLGLPGLIMNDGKPQIDVGYTEGTVGFRHHNGGHTDALDWPAFFELIKKNMKPWRQDSAITFSNLSAGSLTLTWGIGNGTKRAVFMKENGGSITLPTDSTLYTASSNWAAKGSQLASSGYYCVYNGTGNTVTLTNLQAATSYTVRVFTYNGLPGKEKLMRDTAVNNPAAGSTTALVATPSNHVTNFVAAQSGNNINVTWTDAVAGATPPAGYIIKASTTNLNAVTVANGVVETAGDFIKVVAPGVQTTSFTNTASNTTYYFKIFPYTNPNSNLISYKTDGMVPSATVAIAGLTAANNYFRSKANGAWNAISTWESSADNNAWIPATLTPTNTARYVTIDGNDTVTVTANATAANFVIKAGSQVTVNSGITFTIPNNLPDKEAIVYGTLKNMGTVTNTGAISIEAGGVYEQATNSATFAANLAYQPGSLLRLTGSYTTNVTLPTNTYRNITFAGTLAAANYFTIDGAGTTTIAEKLLITQTGAGEVALTAANNGTGFTIGSYEQTGGTVYVNRNVAGTKVFTIVSDMTVSGGIFDLNKAGTTTGALGLINVGGNVNIGAAAIFRSSANTAGNVSNVMFNGSAPQTAAFNGTMNGAVGIGLNNVQGLTLLSPLNIIDTLNLMNGRILLGSNMLTANVIMGANANAFVVTNGTGTLRQRVATGSVMFPVGPTLVSYNPVMLTNSGTADSFMVKVQTGITAATPFMPSKVVNLQWDISEMQPGGSNVDVMLQWNTFNQAVSFNPASAAIMGHYMNNAWDKRIFTPVAVSSGVYSGITYGHTSFSPFVVAQNGALDGVLPLRTLTLSATGYTDKVNVKWTATDEVNLKNYGVERSIDGVNFSAAGSVIARNSMGKNEYSFDDIYAGKDIIYYRLKIIGVDGNYVYSDVVAVNLKGVNVLTLLPNPVKDNLFVSHSKAGKGATLSIIAVNGSKLSTVTVAPESIQTTLPTDKLLPGTYFLQYQDGGKVQSKRFVKL